MVEQRTIREWKKRFEYILIVEVQVSENDVCIGYYKRPTDSIIDLCSKELNLNGLATSMDFLANNTWLGGDHRQQIVAEIAVSAQVSLWSQMQYILNKPSGSEIKKNG